MSVPFVGRERELDAASDLIRRAVRERAPAFALITGEPGSGKSRLLAEIGSGSEQQAQFIRVIGFEPIQRIPLAAVGEFLRLLARVPGDGAKLEALAFGGVADRDPLRIFEAAHRALGRVGPLLLTVDDLHWVDERSLALIHYLVRSAESAHQPLVVVAATRPAAAAWTFRASLEAALPAIRRAAIELGPLPRDDGVALVRGIDADMDESAAVELWRRARGSPFWLEALARSDDGGRPTSILDARLRSLSGDAGALLGALAVGARPFPPDDAVGVLGWNAARVRQAARELVARGLALEAHGSIRLAHDLIREAAVGDLPRSARRLLHARLADWIEAAAGDDLQSLLEALEHRAAAGLPTIDLAQRLLMSRQRRLLGRDGVRLVASIRDGLAAGTTEQLSIDRGLGELAAVLGDQELALDSWTRIAEHSDDDLERHRASVEAARATYRLRQGDVAHAHLDRARATLPPAAEAAVTLDALQAEIELWLDHETAVGNRTAERALAAAQKLAAEAGGIEKLTPSARRASLAAHEAAFDGALQQDRAEEALRLSEACVLLVQGLDQESQLGALLRPAFGLRPLGRVQEAEARYRRAWDLARQHVYPAAMAEAGQGLARVLRDLGRLAEARAVAAETVELESRLGHPPRRWGNAPSILHGIELALGDSAALDALRNDAATETDPHYRLAIHQAIAAWQARLHGPRLATEVVAELDGARSDSALAGCPRCNREVTVYAAEMLARVGLVRDATRELATWEASPTSDYLMQRVWGSRARAAIALAAGDEGTSVVLIEGLIRVLEPAGLVEDLLWARLDLGRALVRADRARAVDAYAEAAALAERMGAVSQGRLAIQALRRLGVRAWRRGRAAKGDGLGSLSGREREVARLVAEGETNRQIADALLVSPKTVERHLTNVLAKLGLRNRTELAALVRSTVVRGSPDD